MSSTDKEIDEIVEARVQQALDQKLGPLVDERIAKVLAEHEAKQPGG